MGAHPVIYLRFGLILHYKTIHFLGTPVKVSPPVVAVAPGRSRNCCRKATSRRAELYAWWFGRLDPAAVFFSFCHGTTAGVASNIYIYNSSKNTITNSWSNNPSYITILMPSIYHEKERISDMYMILYIIIYIYIYIYTYLYIYIYRMCMYIYIYRWLILHWSSLDLVHGFPMIFRVRPLASSAAGRCAARGCSAPRKIPWEINPMEIPWIPMEILWKSYGNP